MSWLALKSEPFLYTQLFICAAGTLEVGEVGALPENSTGLHQGKQQGM